MTDTIYRDFGAELEVRSASNGGDGRTVYGYAVPFDCPTVIDDRLTEAFERNAFDHQMKAIHRVSLFHGHNQQGGKHVGHLTMARADVQGLYVEGRASKTRDGDDFLEMINDGSLPHWSIGFMVPSSGSQQRGSVTWRTRANLTEVAGVPAGAYGDDASVGGTRSATNGVCATCGNKLVAVERSAIELPLLELPPIHSGLDLPPLSR